MDLRLGGHNAETLLQQNSLLAKLILWRESSCSKFIYGCSFGCPSRLMVRLAIQLVIQLVVRLVVQLVVRLRAERRKKNSVSLIVTHDVNDLNSQWSFTR